MERLEVGVEGGGAMREDVSTSLDLCHSQDSGMRASERMIAGVTALKLFNLFPPPGRR